MKFQKISPRLRPAVKAIVRESGMFTDREVDVCMEIAEECVSKPETDEYFFECAVDEQDRPVGFVVYGDASTAEGVGELYWIVVDPRMHRNGLGRSLLRRAEEGMRARGARMSLIEASGRPEASGPYAFYQRCGYSEAARIRDYYREGDDLVIFRRDFGDR